MEVRFSKKGEGEDWAGSRYSSIDPSPREQLQGCKDFKGSGKAWVVLRAMTHEDRLTGP